jgi:hypothetical protein
MLSLMLSLIHKHLMLMSYVYRMVSVIIFVVVVSNDLCLLLWCPIACCCSVQLLRYPTIDYMQISQAIACRSLIS